ncbi:peptidylprolyl isomerase [Helicobacter sp.]|uniref:peptidylprolyl isomerase n=1 Tax=Helicobacter sp. TaxID=218 RepID=UPI0025C25A15|nr:peptidylprolyl isomerase [Helicobacter sp.]MCI5968430.1 peptidylprolyl isomerase [Helicobacter sp.]MDY2585215.1 peptidylprolyl isomerase [Helicobacter sp.]
MRALILFLLNVFGALFLNAQQIQNAEKIKEAKVLQAVLETTSGKITLDLFPQVAPKAVENFVTHINNGYYNGILFHRVIRKFMIQGGDPTGTGRGGESIWGEDFEDEIVKGYAFDRAGILAMANAGANTNGSQFFITTTRTPHLNGKHTIFGEISKEHQEESFKTLRKIEYTPTDYADKPLKEQKILKAYIIAP